MNAASDALTEENSAAAESKTQGNRAGRKMPRLSQNEIGENLRAGVYWIARLWFRGVFYGRTLRGRRPQALTMIPEENWPGSSDRGAGLVDGRFRFLNHTVSAEDSGCRPVGYRPVVAGRVSQLRLATRYARRRNGSRPRTGAYLYVGMDGREPEMASRQLAAGCNGTPRL